MIEMGKFNKLLKKMKSTLVEVQRALKGTVVMSADLDAMCQVNDSKTIFNMWHWLKVLLPQALLFQRVPSAWANAGYLSLKPLGSWFKVYLTLNHLFSVHRYFGYLYGFHSLINVCNRI